MKGYLENLNSEQLEAVTTLDGSVLVLAGAGTGKTTTIVSRVFHLVESGVEPENILLMTFTNKASNEMFNRIKSNIASRKKLPFVGTFHKFGNLFLTHHSGLLDSRNSNFGIVEYSEIKSIVKDILNIEGLSVELNVDEVIKDISNLKNANIHFYEPEKSNLKDDYKKQLFHVYRLYEDTLENSNLVDLDDLQLITFRILQRYPKLAQKYSEKYKYIMIDEFQDTNVVQYEIIKLLLSNHNNIFVVGDDDQSIYGWRGAEVENILNFDRDFENTKVITLNRNYRSRSEIVDASNSLIEYNRYRIDKKIISHRGAGGKIIYKNFPDDSLESMFIASEIQRLIIEEKSSPDDIAVLYRVNALSFNIENALLEKSIPYSIKGKKSIYARVEIKEIINYLNLFVDPYNDTSFINVLKQTQGIGEQSISVVLDESKRENLSIYETIKFANIQFLLKTRARYFINLVDKLDDFLAQIAEDKTNFVDIFEETFEVKAGYLKKLESSTISKEAKEKLQDRVNNINSFYSLLEKFFQSGRDENIRTFLNLYAINGEDEKESGDEKVSLVSIHLSKGLEFKHVFVVGMNSGFLPSYGNYENEEERRLAYVAFTRAKDSLYLTSASSRMVYGNRQDGKESKYLYEAKVLKKDFREKSEKPVYKPRREVISTDRKSLKKGDIVRHKKFGFGTVISTSKEGDNKFLDIHFPNDPDGSESRKILERVVEKV